MPPDDDFSRQLSTGYVYFVQQGLDGPIKIGWTTKLSERLSDLQTGSPQQLQVIGILQAHPAFEKMLHRELAAYRIGGEWFENCEEVHKRLQELPTLAKREHVPFRYLSVHEPPELQPFEESVRDMRAIAHTVHQAFLRQHAPYCVVVHKTGNAVLDYSLHLERLGAAEEAKRAVRETTSGALVGVCFFARNMDTKSPEWRRWKPVATAGACPGLCHTVLPT